MTTQKSILDRADMKFPPLPVLWERVGVRVFASLLSPSPCTQGEGWGGGSFLARPDCEVQP